MIFSNLPKMSVLELNTVECFITVRCSLPDDIYSINNEIICYLNISYKQKKNTKVNQNSCLVRYCRNQFQFLGCLYTMKNQICIGLLKDFHMISYKHKISFTSDSWIFSLCVRPIGSLQLFFNLWSACLHFRF